MAKKKVSKPAVEDVPTTKKRLQPVEEPLTANKRLKLAEDPPTAPKSPQPLKTLPPESSDDGEEMATEEESDSSSDENEQNKSVKTPSSKNTLTPASASVIAATKEKQSSDSDSGSETESESDSESETKKKEVCGSNEAQPTKKTKQPSEVVASTDVQPNTNGKKEYFQRKWSEEDEIVLLQGMIDYKNDTGKSPYDDMHGFFEIIKNKISFEVMRKQFASKISSLKKKYVGTRNKAVDEKSFSNAHEQKCFKLCKLIWESVKLEESFKPNDELFERDCFLNSFLVGSMASYGIEKDVVKQRWNMVPMMTKKKLGEKWKLLLAKEFECVLLKTNLLNESTSVISKAN